MLVFLQQQPCNCYSVLLKTHHVSSLFAAVSLDRIFYICFHYLLHRRDLNTIQANSSSNKLELGIDYCVNYYLITVNKMANNL